MSELKKCFTLLYKWGKRIFGENPSPFHFWMRCHWKRPLFGAKGRPPLPLPPRQWPSLPPLWWVPMSDGWPNNGSKPLRETISAPFNNVCLYGVGLRDGGEREGNWQKITSSLVYICEHKHYSSKETSLWNPLIKKCHVKGIGSRFKDLPCVLISVPKLGGRLSARTSSQTSVTWYISGGQIFPWRILILARKSGMFVSASISSRHVRPHSEVLKI